MNINKLFSYLKEDTADSHKALENTYPFSQQMNKETFTSQSYSASLHTLLAFHTYATPFVQGLPESIQIQAKIDSVHHALIEDIKALASSPSLTPSLACSTMPVNPESQLACAYVWIGSSMGASIIARWMKKEYPHFPISYYTIMTNVGANWSSFREQATDYAGSRQVDIHLTSLFANQLFTGLMNTARLHWPSE